MQFKHKIYNLIVRRKSSRTFQKFIVDANVQHQILLEIKELPASPFHSELRLELIPFQEGDEKLVQELGTYGMIKNPNGYLAGIVSANPMSLVDLGHQLQYMVLRLTDMELGSCWLGGSFQKSRFAGHVKLSEQERLPIVIAFGMIGENQHLVERLARWAVKADKRLPWKELFFEYDFEESLKTSGSEIYDMALEGVRLAPSASNKQPWRVVKEPKKNVYHFYLQRSKHYKRQEHIINMADVQMVDMGIAMCHFEAILNENQKKGAWRIDDPDMPNMPSNTEYIVSWVETV